MIDLWTTLLPLAIAGALVPFHLIITILLLKGPGGRIPALAWVAGMTTVRLAQGLVFGLLLGAADGRGSGSGPGTAASLLLLVLAVLFYVTAGKHLLKQPDEDAPPPAWMSMLDGVGPGRAYLLGLGLLGLGAKFWVFTLGAIAAIGEADLGQAASIATFLVFVALTQVAHLVLVGAAFAVPERSAAMLDRVSALMTAYNRPIMIVIGLVFGTWFLVKALGGLGIV